MPSQSTSRRRRRSAPPPRLSWPGDLLAVDTTTHKSQPTGNTTTSSNSVNADENKHKRNSNSQATTNAKASHKKKRQRTLLPALTNASSSKDGTVDMNGGSLMWVDKYAPTTRQELCIAPKKVNEVAAWLDHHTIMNNGNNKKHNHAYNNADHDKKLLILVGRPGIGKSTMMRVLAAESNLDILEWNDSYSAYSHQLESLTPLNSFAQFLQQGGVGFTSLDVQESTVVSSFSALEASLSSPTKSQNETLSTDNNTHPTTRRGGLILLEELPHLHNSESQERFCDLLTNHVQHSHVPTVWIYSEGSEGQHKPADLERHIRPDILYRHAKILQINPITTTKVKQCLERIAKAQGNSFQVTKDFCERLQLQSGGDIRYAINALQFDQSLCSKSNDTTTSKLKGKKRGSKKTAAPEAASTEHTRDTQFTAFHALGKLLYAKREPVTKLSSLSSNSQESEERTPLNFVPEQVLEQCDMDLGHALTYLEFHCADFFTDVEELSTALELYSDASYLLEQTTNFSYQRRHRQHQHTTMVSCPIFPEGYVTSLTGRAVAHANRHPAPSRFRSLQAPKVLEIRRKRNDNAYHLERLQHRLSMLSMAEISGNNNSSRKMVSSAALSSLPSFVMDQLPFMRTIVPNGGSAVKIFCVLSSLLLCSFFFWNVHSLSVIIRCIRCQCFIGPIAYKWLRKCGSMDGQTKRGRRSGGTAGKGTGRNFESGRH